MKNALKFSAVALIAIATLAGCTRGPSSSAPTSSGPYFDATISGGGSFHAPSTLITTSKNAASPHPYVEVRCKNTAGDSMFFFIYAYTSAPGTIPVDGSQAGASYTPAAGGTGGASTHGLLTISSVSTSMIGTITFTCIDSTLVTGSFNITAP